MINQAESLEKHLRSSPVATWPASVTFVFTTHISGKQYKYKYYAMNLLNITYKNKALLSDIKVLSFQFCARYTEVEDKFNLKVCIIQRFQLLSQIFED